MRAGCGRGAGGVRAASAVKTEIWLALACFGGFYFGRVGCAPTLLTFSNPALLPRPATSPDNQHDRLKIAPNRGTTGNSNDNQLVYGPMEAGFSAQQTTQNFGCTNGLTLSGGIDTLMAERMVHAQALLGNCNTGVEILNACGGHAMPFHYHERLSCLHTNNATTGHSTSVALMLDGKTLCKDLDLDTQVTPNPHL